ncbi:MAG: hypothetical protein ACI9L6_001285 [Flavobacterium sp.]|jgi:hypothetical protein
MINKYIFLFFLTSACNSPKYIIHQSVTPIISTPKIIFLNYKISRIPDELVEIIYVNKIITEGKLKDNFTNDFNPKKGDIKLIQMNSRHQAIDSIYIPNPLYKTVEFVNELEQMEKKTMKLDSAEFYVRMQLNPKTMFVTVCSHDNPYKQLIQHKL